MLLGRLLSDNGFALSHTDSDCDLAIVELGGSDQWSGDFPFESPLLTSFHERGVPVIVLTAFATVELAVTLMRDYGVLTVLRKQNFQKHQLESLIQGRSSLPLRIDPLTPREGEVLDLLGQGLTNAQLASRLRISPNTVKLHLKSIFAKLGVNTRAAAVAAVSRRS